MRLSTRIARPHTLAAGFLLVLLGAAAAARDDDADPVHDGKKASEWVDALINDASPRKRALAVDALAGVWAAKRYKDALPTIGRALRLDSSVAVRARAAAALGGLKDTDGKLAERDLIDALGKEKESRVRKEIALAIGKFPDVARHAVVPLTAVLADPDPATRIAAADALASTGAEGKSAAAGLAPLLQDPDKGVRLAGVMALGRTSPEGASAIAETMAKLLGIEKDLDLKTELVRSLALLGEKSPVVVAALASRLVEPDEELRKKAVHTLAAFGVASAPAAEALYKTAERDANKDIRADAVHAFGSALGPTLKDRLKDLFALLKDPEFEVRMAVVEEVGALGNAVKDDKDTMTALRIRLSDPHIKVREAAAAAIRRIEKKPEAKKEP